MNEPLPYPSSVRCSFWNDDDDCSEVTCLTQPCSSHGDLTDSTNHDIAHSRRRNSRRRSRRRDSRNAVVTKIRISCITDERRLCNVESRTPTGHRENYSDDCNNITTTNDQYSKQPLHKEESTHDQLGYAVGRTSLMIVVSLTVSVLLGPLIILLVALLALLSPLHFAVKNVSASIKRL
mmetsp:Transcript_12554/g.23894  ORF Transcript_12554/g.23894 Transcript_12554/m.23894 type:complete len:179 (+) Transcript_12554:306-842(+)